MENYCNLAPSCGAISSMCAAVHIHDGFSISSLSKSVTIIKYEITWGSKGVKVSYK